MEDFGHESGQKVKKTIKKKRKVKKYKEQENLEEEELKICLKKEPEMVVDKLDPTIDNNQKAYDSWIDVKKIDDTDQEKTKQLKPNAEINNQRMQNESKSKKSSQAYKSPNKTNEIRSD